MVVEVQENQKMLDYDSSSLLTPRQMYEETKASGGVDGIWLTRWYQIPCDCSRCSKQYRSYKKQQSNIMCLYVGRLSMLETESISQSFCTRLFDDLKIVRSLFLSHGERVNTQWLNKAKCKRRKILKRLKEDMYANEDALIEIFEDEKVCPDDMSTRDFRDVFLLPYMTVEALSTDGSRLLRLLRHRAFHPPEEWVAFDNRQLHLGWSMYALDEKMSPGCIIMHGESYGKWTPFDATAVHNGDSYGAPRALLILEAQSLLVGFLRDFMTLMVANIEKLDAQQGYSEDYRRGMLQETSGIQPSITYYNQPFSPPPVFNTTTIDELLEIVSGKQAETQDHLWLLQTDCRYFYNLACYWKENSYDAAFGAKAGLGNIKSSAFGIRLICTPLRQVLEWQHLAEELHLVRQAYTAQRKDIVVGQALPKDYAMSLEKLQRLVLAILEDRVFQLKELTIVSPHWRSKWEEVGELGLSEGAFVKMKMKTDGSKNNSQLHKKDHVLLCLSLLCEGTTNLQDWDMALVLKSLDLHLAKCGTKEARKIDPIVYSKITDLAAMYRILTAVHMHRPTPSLLYTLSTEIPSKTGTGTWRAWPHLDKMKQVFEDPQSFRFWHKLDSLDNFKIPKGKKNEEWLDRADSASRALSQLWSLARDDYKRIYRSRNDHNVDIEEAVRLLSYHDSPDVLAAAAHEREEILADIIESRIRKSRAVNEAIQYESSIPHSSTFTDLPKKAAKVPTVKTKPKVQRKGISSMKALSKELSPAPICPSDAVPVVGLLPLPKKTRSLETLRLLFPTAVSELKGAVQWIDFLATMQELGCSGQHRGGSEFTFWPPNDDKEAAGSDGEAMERRKKGISIHQPHPEPKLEAERLQWIGKRLRRSFGWTRECFEGL